MRSYKFFPILLILSCYLHSNSLQSTLLEAPYPPPYTHYGKEIDSPKNNFNSVDDLANYEVGRDGSLQRDDLEYHSRLISAIETEEDFHHLHLINGYLVKFTKNTNIPTDVKQKIESVFDKSMRRIYYAGYGWETLEEALYDHEKLQSTISRHYPEGIPLSPSRLSAYYKAMAYGYRENHQEKIKTIRKKRLKIITISKDEKNDILNPGINPVRVVLDKENETPLAIWKAGSDKYYGKFILMAMNSNAKLYELERAKVETGQIALWNELLAQGLNYLARGKFLTPAVARFGNTTLHAYHPNEGSLSHLMQTTESMDSYVESLDTAHVQNWGMMQFLMSSSDSHRGNTLIDGKYLILIDFGRALGPFQSKLHFLLRTTALDWPQMKSEFTTSNRELFGWNLAYEFDQFFSGIEEFEERKSVKSLIQKSVNHLNRNLRAFTLAIQKNLTPIQIFRLKYPSIELADHFSLVTLFQEMHHKDPYCSEVKDREFRLTLVQSKLFESIPFAKAFTIAKDDEELFDYLIEREMDTILQMPDEELFTEIQLGWLIKASLVIPLKIKPFF